MFRIRLDRCASGRPDEIRDMVCLGKSIKIELHFFQATTIANAGYTFNVDSK